MEFEIRIEGDVVERQELLNGTETVTLEGATADEEWAISSVVAWNRGLLDFEGEGDLTLVRRGGSELYGTLERVTARDGEPEEGLRLTAFYSLDGGTGELEGRAGHAEAEIRLAEREFEGVWRIKVENETPNKT